MPSVVRDHRTYRLSPIERARLVACRPVRQHLTYGEKLEVIDFYHEHKMFLAIEAMVQPLRDRGFLTIHRTTICRCVRDEERIRRHVAEDPNRLYAKNKSIVCHPAVEQALIEWIYHKLNNHIRLRDDVLMEKARELCDLLGIPPGDRIGFSRGWLGRFKRRHGLHQVRFSGERTSIPFEHVIAERARLQLILAEYAPYDTYNIDETAVYGSQPPTSGLGTWDSGGLKSNKSRLTVALAVPDVVPEEDIPLTAGDIITQLSLDAQKTRPCVFDAINALDISFPTEEDLTLEQIVQEMHPNIPLHSTTFSQFGFRGLFVTPECI